MAIPSDLVLARPARDAILRRALQWGILLRGLVDALRYRSNFFGTSEVTVQGGRRTIAKKGHQNLIN